MRRAERSAAADESVVSGAHAEAARLDELRERLDEVISRLQEALRG